MTGSKCLLKTPTSNSFSSKFLFLSHFQNSASSHFSKVCTSLELCYHHPSPRPRLPVLGRYSSFPVFPPFTVSLLNLASHGSQCSHGKQWSDQGMACSYHVQNITQFPHLGGEARYGGAPVCFSTLTLILAVSPPHCPFSRTGLCWTPPASEPCPLSLYLLFFLF